MSGIQKQSYIVPDISFFYILNTNHSCIMKRKELINNIR